MVKKDYDNKCVGMIEIREDGNFTLSDMSKSCPVILRKVNPVRGIFWKNHLSDEDKKKFELGL